MNILSPTPPRRDSWPPTRWSKVLQLEAREEPEWGASWEWLVENYRPPMERYVRRFLSRHSGRTWQQAEVEDVIQDFLLKCVSTNLLSKADDRHLFRKWIQRLLRFHCYEHLRSLKVKRKNPPSGAKVHPIREDDRVDESSPEDLADIEDFDRSWVQIAVDRVIDRLRRENPPYHTVILDLVATDGKGSSDLHQRVSRSRSAVAVLKTHVRDRFERLFAEELAHTVGNREAFEEEWRAVLPFVARRRRKRKPSA